MRQFFLTIVLCVMTMLASAQTVYTWTGNQSASWSNSGNWNPSVVPSQSDNVVIPAGRPRYPELIGGEKCKNIYFEIIYMDGIVGEDISAGDEIKTTTSARIKNQHLLTYEKAFCDIKIRANRWVRITAPLKNTYSGDYFIKQQTLDERAWGGKEYNLDGSENTGAATPADWHFVEAYYKANNKSDDLEGYRNRSRRGTYYSYYSSMQVVHDAYTGVDIEELTKFVSQWGEPSNPLSTPIQPAMGFDVWVNRGSREANGVVAFRFPASNEQYYYYQTDGEIATTREPDAIDRSTKHGKMALDKDDVDTDGRADYTVTREGAGTHSKMFAVGNPAFSYLDIAKFIDKNVSLGHTYRYVYAHNEEFTERGNEDIYFYNYPVEEKLYRLTTKVNPSDGAATGDNPNASSASKNVVINTSRSAYLNPAEGFRVFGGGVSYKCDEPDLIGVYRGATATLANDLCRKYYNNQGKLDTTNYSKLEIPMFKRGYVDFDYSITVVPGHPEQVRINNFLNLGSVIATINREAQTLTIAKGTPMMSVFGAADASTGKPGDDFWSFTPGDGTATALTYNGSNASYRILKIYGTTDSNWQFSSTKFTIYEGTGTSSGGGDDDAFINAQNIVNSTATGSNACDIKLKYSITADGAVSIALDNSVRKVFLRSDVVSNNFQNAPAYHHDEDYMESCQSEAWMAFEGVISTKAADTNSSFIMKDMDMEGTYKVKVKSVSGNSEVSAGNTYQDIQIARISGRNDVVSVTGLFPNDNTTPALGEIDFGPNKERKTATQSFSVSDFSSSTSKKRGNVTVVMPNKSSNFEWFWSVVKATKGNIRIYSDNSNYRITSVTLRGFSGKLLGTYYAGRWSSNVGSVSSAWRNYQTWVGDANDITLTNTRNTHILGDDSYFGGVKIERIDVTYEWYTEGSDVYHLYIPGGQLVHIADANGNPAPQNDYYFYTHGNAYARTNTIEMIWHPATASQQGYWETTSYSKNKDNHNTMVSRQGWQPDAPSSISVSGQLGWVLGESARNDGSIETCYLDRVNANYTEDGGYDATEDFSENAASTSSFIDLTFTPDMFVANIPTSSSAPKRTGSVVINAPVIITATTADNMQACTMIVQDYKANDDFHATEDAPIFDVASYSFAFGTLAGSHLVGVNSISQAELIPLYISQSATLRFSHISTLGDAYLYDAVADTRVLINDSSTYVLEIADGQQAGRYFIETNIEAPAVETAVEDVLTYSWKPVAYCPANGSLSVACADDTVRFTIYTLGGLSIGESCGSHTFHGLTAGAYIVSAVKGNEQQGLKVIVY